MPSARLTSFRIIPHCARGAKMCKIAEGDEEDREGHPFVEPSGKLLGRALIEAGIDRSLV
jgi:uracil-DNA glycosylase